MEKPRDMISFPRFFNASELGNSLKEVSTDVMATDYTDIVTRWLHSAEDADLFIWMDLNRNVIKQQLSFYGQVVEWNLVEGVKTGLIVEEGQEGERSSEMVRFDAHPQSGPVAQAIELISHVMALKDEERRILKDNFANPQDIKTMSTQHFNERFGSFLQSQGLPALRPSLWARIKAWLLGKS